MKYSLMIFFGLLTVVLLADGTWTTERLGSFLRNSGRFVESDNDEDGESDVSNRNHDALPLFADVIAESGWSTNDLVMALITVASNGLSEANWALPEQRKSAAIAIAQLSDIDHPYVTNYFNAIVGVQDLHGLENTVIPALFKYTCLEPGVVARLYDLCAYTNRYDRAAAMVALDLLDCLESMPSDRRPAATTRVAQYMYHSMRQVSSSQTWQDEQLARLVPSYSNSIQRLNQMEYFLNTVTNSYERGRAISQYNRLSAIPTNELNNVSWLMSH